MSITKSNTMSFVFAVWLSLSLGVSLSGMMTALRPPFPQVVILTLTLVAWATTIFVPFVRQLADTVAIRGLVALHLTRFFAGAYFLVLARDGSLSRSFALPAGWGDIAVAIFGATLLLTTTPHSGPGRRAYALWNLLGLADIMMVVTNAARAGLVDPASMRPLLELPLSILPTFLVPLIIVSHILLLRRLRGERRSGVVLPA